MKTEEMADRMESIDAARLNWILLIGFLLSGLVILSPILQCSFLSDDYVVLESITRMEHFESGFMPIPVSLRPASSLFFLLDYAVWKFNPVGYHLTNVILHSICAFMVYLIAVTLARRAAGLTIDPRWIGLFAGVIFLTLPTHSEPVSWIAGRTDVVAALFGLIALYTYLRFRTTGRTGYLVASVIVFALGVLSKESAFAIALVILLYELARWRKRVPRGRRMARSFIPCIPYFAVSGAYLLVRYLLLGTLVGGYEGASHLLVAPRRMLISLASLPARTFLPPMPTPALCVSVFGALTVLVIALLIWVYRRRGRPVPRLAYLVLASYLLSLLPVASLTISKVDTQGERLIYLPSALGVILSVVVIAFLARTLRNTLIVVALLSLVSGVMLYSACDNWVQASRLSDSAIDSLEGASPNERLFILNLPDNLNGAYIFRSGLAEALRLAGSEGRSPEIVSVARYEMRKQDDTVSITQRRDTLDVHLSNPRARFSVRDLEKGKHEGKGTYGVVAYSETAYTVKFADIGTESHLVYHHQGKFLRYDLPPR